MRYNETQLRAILEQLVDDNPLACRALLGICRLELSTRIPTACVTLGEQPKLLVNPVFLDTHCPEEDDVRFILLHEFMHVLLRHTQRFTRMTPQLNLALDLVINPLLYRVLGEERCGVLQRYYGNSTGLARLLAPCLNWYGTSCIQRDPLALFDRSGQPTARFSELHDTLWDTWQPCSLEDVLELLADTAGVPNELLLGDHDAFERPQAMGNDLLKRLEREALPALAKHLPGLPGSPQATQLWQSTERWKSGIVPILRRLLVPQGLKQHDPDGPPRTVELPWLSTTDRRAVLRSTWSAVMPFSRHQQPTPTNGGVHIYLDVSGSMDELLPPLIAVLNAHAAWIHPPLWAFSTKVHPATLRRGKLLTHSTGGTELACVYDHLKRTGARRALVITDGYVEKVRPPEGCTVEALITHDGYADNLSACGVRVTRLPVFPKG